MARGVTLPSVWQRRMVYAMLNYWYGVVEPAVAIGSSKEQIAIGGTAVFVVDGVALPGTQVLAAQDEDILTGLIDLKNNQGCRILVCTQADATVTGTQGPILTLAEITAGETLAQMKVRAELPGVPDGEVVLGECYINTGAAETFVMGTTNLDAGATNGTYRDLLWPDSGDDAFDLTGAQDG